MSSHREREKRRTTMLDKLARMLEQLGFPHTIAKVYAALMLAEGEGLSTSDLVDELGVSKASISNAMQFLIGTSLAERYRVRGSREAHYRMVKGVWGDVFEKKFAAMSYLRNMTEEAMDVIDSPAARERLKEMHDVCAFFEKEFEDVMQRWNERMDR